MTYKPRFGYVMYVVMKNRPLEEDPIIAGALEGQADIEAGRCVRFEDVEDAVAYLKNL